MAILLNSGGLSDNNIAGQLQAPEATMGQYDRIADAIETLDKFPKRVKILNLKNYE